MAFELNMSSITFGMFVVNERDRLKIQVAVDDVRPSPEVTPKPERNESVAAGVSPIWALEVATAAAAATAAEEEGEASDSADEDAGKLSRELGCGVGSGVRMRLRASAVPREAPTMPRMMRKTSNQI